MDLSSLKPYYFDSTLSFFFYLNAFVDICEDFHVPTYLSLIKLKIIDMMMYL